MSPIRIIQAALLVTFSCSLLAEDTPVQCNGSSWSRGSLGDLENFELGEEVSFQQMLKEVMAPISEGIDLLIRLETNPTDEDLEFIEGIIDFLEAPSDKSLSCLWAQRQEFDVLHKFEEFEEYERRTGYILVREGVFVAYFYVSVAIV